MRKSGDMIRDQVRILYLLFLWLNRTETNKSTNSNNSNKTLFQHTDHVNLN